MTYLDVRVIFNVHTPFISPVIFPVLPTLSTLRDLNFIYYSLHLFYFHNMKQQKKTHFAKNMTFEIKIFDGREIMFGMGKTK